MQFRIVRKKNNVIKTFRILENNCLFFLLYLRKSLVLLFLLYYILKDQNTHIFLITILHYNNNNIKYNIKYNHENNSCIYILLISNNLAHSKEHCDLIGSTGICFSSTTSPCFFASAITPSTSPIFLGSIERMVRVCVSDKR